MKSNDNIPRDEMLLAEAIAAARAHGLGWTRGRAFLPSRQKPKLCCAAGALVLAGRGQLARGKQYLSGTQFDGVTLGNDFESEWHDVKHDRGESLGWAFRLAMTQEEGQ